ncbi:MAG: hypothetical protein HKL90_10465 [Elusimicrobia bacterium]|nr:hypothetical protein [Elusimicrobiota bacterium]
MSDLDADWMERGATLSHQKAQKEFDLTWAEIVDGINAGKLHCRKNSYFGNPFLRLLRCEVEALVKKKRGVNYLKEQKAKKELARINTELRGLKMRIAMLENKKSKLMGQS